MNKCLKTEPGIFWSSRKSKSTTTTVSLKGTFIHIEKKEVSWDDSTVIVIVEDGYYYIEKGGGGGWWWFYAAEKAPPPSTQPAARLCACR